VFGKCELIEAIFSAWFLQRSELGGGWPAGHAIQPLNPINLSDRPILPFPSVID
jgi:hypothetical protein